MGQGAHNRKGRVIIQTISCETDVVKSGTSQWSGGTQTHNTTCYRTKFLFKKLYPIALSILLH